MNHGKPSRARWAAVAVLALSAAACADENTLEDGALVTVSDLADVFTYSATNLDNVTDHDRHLWFMQGDQARMTTTQELTDGTAFIQIRGGDGEVVYSEDIPSSVDTTEVNIPGIWQVDIVFEEASGGVAFTLERDTIP